VGTFTTKLSFVNLVTLCEKPIQVYHTNFPNLTNSPHFISRKTKLKITKFGLKGSNISSKEHSEVSKKFYLSLGLV
jgi:hypothetical protein